MGKRQQYPWNTPSPPWCIPPRPPCLFVSHLHVYAPLHRKNKRLLHKSSQGHPSRHIVRYISWTFTHLRKMSANRTVHVRYPRPAYGPADSRSPPYPPYSALALSSAFKYHTPISRFSNVPYTHSTNNHVRPQDHRILRPWYVMHCPSPHHWLIIRIQMFDSPP